jgi:hypothetical protein
VLALMGAGLMVPMGGASAPPHPAPHPGAKPVPLSEFSSDAPKKPLHILFIHHSVGGRILADNGARERIAEEIWKSHPDGGGLRKRLTEQGYQVHEASYGSQIGDRTDRGDWLGTFRDKMDRTLTCGLNDQPLPDGQRNQIVVWKSCFPNNMLDDDAAVAQAKATLTALLPYFAKHPEVLFVHVTSPPNAPAVAKEPAWKFAARAVLGKPQPGPRLIKSGPLARQLNDWVTRPDGWLKDYPHKNLVVFDLFDLLTDGGKSDFLAYPTGGGTDSHPSRAGNERAAAEMVPFLNRAVRRAGLSE